MFKLNTAHALALSSLLVAGPGFAGVIAVPDLAGATAGYNEERALGVTITNDPAIYLVGTVTVDDITALDGSFNEANMTTSGDSTGPGFGNAFGQATITIANDGTAGETGIDFVNDVSTQLVMKFDQTTGDVTLYVDPDLGTTEANNTPDATNTLGNVDGSSFDTLLFRGGDFGGEQATIDYTDFSVYHDGDTPFVPEPTSLALLGLGGLVLARRRRG